MVRECAAVLFFLFSHRRKYDDDDTRQKKATQTRQFDIKIIIKSNTTDSS